MTLRRKILSLTLGLLVLFAVTAAASVILQNRMNYRFDLIVQDQLPLNAASETIDVATDAYELGLLRRAVGLPHGGAAKAAGTLDIEAARLQDAELLTTTFRRFEDILERMIADPRLSVEDRIALSNIHGRFTYMERALPDFIDAGRAVSEAVRAGDNDEAVRMAARFAPYRPLFGADVSAVRQELATMTARETVEVARWHRQLILLEVVMLCLASLLGISLAIAVSNRMMSGLSRLVEGTKRVQGTENYELLPVTSRDEIGALTIAFNQMVEDLRAKDRIKETFGKFVDPRVVGSLIDASGETIAERQVATVFFSDIKGFSGLSELLTAPTMVKLLNTYFSKMGHIIHRRRGFIDKYIGDGVMAFWTAPFSPGETHAVDACLAALAQQEAIAGLREDLPDILGMRRNLPDFSVRMGIATGDVIVGTVGSEAARSFTAIGDTVNLASRLEGVNKAFATRILIDETTFRLAQQDVEVRELDFITVVGRMEPTRVYEVMGPFGTLSNSQQELCGLFAEGLAAYRARDWDRAEGLFAKCLAVMPDDGPSLAFGDRISLLRDAILSPDWDGVWHATSK
jgi:adenylate cyclase